MSNQAIYSTLRGAGLTAEGACGLMGNMMAESGMKSNIAQRGMTSMSDEQYTTAADTGLIDFTRDSVGYGLCQWTYYTRKAALLACARNRGVSVGDENMQVQFCLKELREDYPAVLDKLCKSHDLLDCAQTVCRFYERPAVNNVGPRYEYAQNFLNTFAAENPPDNHFAGAGDTPDFSGAFGILAEYIKTKEFQAGFLAFAAKREG